MAKLLSVTVKIKNALIQSFCNSFIYHICKPMILTSFDTTSETHGHCGPRQPCLQIWWPQISNRNQIRQIFFHSKCLNLLRHQLVKKKFGNMCLVSIFYITVHCVPKFVRGLLILALKWLCCINDRVAVI